jgi:hypothetical protein
VDRLAATLCIALFWLLGSLGAQQRATREKDTRPISAEELADSGFGPPSGDGADRPRQLPPQASPTKLTTALRSRLS